MGTTAVDPVFIPSHGIHEWFDKDPEGMFLVDFELVQEFPQRLGFAAALG